MQPDGGCEWPLSREPSAFRRAWVGRDGVYDLESIAVVVIGGTLLAGGRGGVWGTLAGVLLFAVLDASFNMLDVSAYPKLVLRGAIVIAAVAIYTFRSRELAA